jgi:hypothetical protein
MCVIPTLNISEVLFYVLPIGMRFSLFLFTYRNAVFVIPALHISDICLFMSYLSEFGFRYSYIKHIGRCDLCYTYRN